MTKIKGVGDNFHHETMYYRNKPLREPQTVFEKPPLYKTYPDAKKIKLVKPDIGNGQPLWKIIKCRRSERNFIDRPLALSGLSLLLWASQGITARFENYGLRAAPSAGALYPVETYLVIHRVEGIQPGVYHYGIEKHELEHLKSGDFGRSIERAAMEQDMVRKAGVVFVWSAVFDRCKWKYGQRAYRYIYLDAGHIAGNLSLAACALGLESCPIAAFYDEEINDIIEVDGEEESAVYLTVVGNIK